jgi:hypothetical protein
MSFANKDEMTEPAMFAIGMIIILTILFVFSR